MPSKAKRRNVFRHVMKTIVPGIHAFIDEFFCLVSLRRSTYGFMFSGFIFFVTIAAIIVSINSTVFKQFDDPSLNNYEFTNPIDIYRFAIEQLPSGGEWPGIAKLKSVNSSDQSKLNYLFLVDVTGSVVQTGDHDKMINQLKQSSKVTELRDANGLKDLTLQSLLTLNTIKRLLEKEYRNELNIDSIDVGFIRGVKRDGDPVSLLAGGKIRKIDENLIQRFVEKDTINNRSGSDKQGVPVTNTYFNDILESPFFERLTSPHLESDDEEVKTVITIISDFQQDPEGMGKKSMAAIDSSLLLLRDKIRSKQSDVQFNLLSIGKSKGAVIEKMDSFLKSDSFLYHYGYDGSSSWLELIDEVITPTFYNAEFSDQFLYSPVIEKKVQHRENIKTYERGFGFEEPGNYRIDIVATYGVDLHLRYAPTNIYDIILQDTDSVTIKYAESNQLRIRQNETLDDEYRFSKIDVYDKTKQTRTRFHLWQVESMTYSGAVYYTVCIIMVLGLVISILVFHLLLLVFTLLTKKVDLKNLTFQQTALVRYLLIGSYFASIIVLIFFLGLKAGDISLIMSISVVPFVYGVFLSIHDYKSLKISIDDYRLRNYLLGLIRNEKQGGDEVMNLDKKGEDSK